MGGSPVSRARQKQGAKDGKKASEEAWWQSNGWKEPPMLPTPIATGRRVDDMRLSLTIGLSLACTERAACAFLAPLDTLFPSSAMKACDLLELVCRRQWLGVSAPRLHQHLGRGGGRAKEH